MSTITIYNQSKQAMLANQAELAATFWSRGKGLLGRRSLPSGYGLIIFPEWSIHMLFMQIPLDIVFVDRQDRVLSVRHSLPPWALYAGVSPSQGWYVIELPAGVLQQTATDVGDQLVIQPHPSQLKP